jgi:hypothetical protein
VANLCEDGKEICCAIKGGGISLLAELQLASQGRLFFIELGWLVAVACSMLSKVIFTTVM